MKESKQGNRGILKSNKARIISAILAGSVERESGLKWVFASRVPSSQCWGLRVGLSPAEINRGLYMENRPGII